MKQTSNKTVTILFALILTVSMTASIVLIPNANAHTPPYYIVSYAYITAAPQPVGVGQSMSVSMWVDYPLPGTLLLNNIRRGGYTLTITSPDGTVTTQTFAIVNDPTGIQSISYVPSQVGNYTFDFSYAGQTYTWNSVNTPGLAASYAAFENDTFSPASASLTVTVQQEPIPTSISSYPLPAEYWTRPIEGQNTYWYTVASNWLAAPYVIGQPPGTHQPGVFQPDGSAPNSAHIMWTKPIQFGGVVGGNDTAVPGEMYYTGNSYNPRFTNPIIMQGTLYYEEPYGNGRGGGDYVAVDLRTGAELWRVNTTATGTSLVPSFGYLYDYETPNQFGVLPNGLLIAATGYGTQTWRAYDPRTGVLTSMNIINVPAGAAAAGPQGEYLKYVLTNYGNATNPDWYLAQWNSSLVFGGGNPDFTTAPLNWYSGTEDASLPSCYDWNVSVNLGGSPTGWGIGTADNGMIPLVDPGNIVLMVQGTFGTHAGDVATITTSKGINLVFDPANITAINLNPSKGPIGETLWSQSYPQAPGNVTRTIAHWDPSNGVFIFEDKETVEHWGYSLADGKVMWGPATKPPSFSSAWNYQSLDSDSIAYGNLYFGGGYSGIIYCYDDTTGQLKWTFGNGGADNTTNSGLATAFGVYPLWATTIADGKIYLAGDVHSPNSPLWKGQQLYALNATDGTQLWSIPNYANNMYGGITPVADGYLVALNNYDSQLYTFGKGPSAMTVDTPMAGIPLGSSLVIRGTITDISAGTQQAEQAARFPNGVPAVSDASQSAWMEYVYMQKPMPTNVTGIEVTLSVLDSNGNFRQIGTTTSDSNGFYSYQWTPDIPGKYTLYASFAGSESYWPSHAETAFAVDSAAPTAAPTAAPVQSAADLYFVPAIIGVIVAIIIVGAVLALLMLRKRP
jgi:outer membrane protein assembly factor BamB